MKLRKMNRLLRVSLETPTAILKSNCLLMVAYRQSGRYDSNGHVHHHNFRSQGSAHIGGTIKETTRSVFSGNDNVNSDVGPTT